jgi:hypothetical protein
MGVRHTIKLGKTGKNIEQRADNVKRKIALEIFRELIETTPVDTGRARAGWSLGPMLTGHVPPKDGTFGVSTTVNPSMAPQDAPIIYIYNNVEYIGRLNAGSSTQAPREFVQIAIDKVVGGMSA